VLQGEVWLASLAEPMGSWPGGRRPVLVVQANEFNASRIHTVIVAVITSDLHLTAAPGNVLCRARETGLPRD
jgi:mRNA interferase MazF